MQNRMDNENDQSIDFDRGDVFVADYHPAGYEDLGDEGVFLGVSVRVLDWDDENNAYFWEIFHPDGSEIDVFEEFGYGFEEFENIRDYHQAGDLHDNYEIDEE